MLSLHAVRSLIVLILGYTPFIDQSINTGSGVFNKVAGNQNIIKCELVFPILYPPPHLTAHRLSQFVVISFHVIFASCHFSCC